MTSNNYQIAYWDKVANEKIFTHPINLLLVETYINRESTCVDFGCGYGRTVKILNDLGFKNVRGFDTSIELIKRGKRNGIKNIVHFNALSDLPVEDNSVDCILLFAVLTCIPDNATQMELLDVLYSKLKVGGIVYVSDYYLQSNPSEFDKYDYLNNDKENYGVFTLPEGVVFRHHTKEWIDKLLKKFKVRSENLIEVKPMNGNKAEAFQLVAQKIETKIL